MKKVKLMLAGVAGVAMLASCGNAGTENQEVEKEMETAEMASGDHLIDTETSTVMWKGTMMGMYSHEGTVPFEYGKLSFTDGKISGGEFVVDLTSITPTDENYSEEKPADKLVGHLQSADFFDVANHPTAKFTVTGSSNDTLMGDLTIRGNTFSEVAIIKDHNKEEHAMTAALTFDRTNYGVSFTHPAKEMVLSNEIELTINLKVQVAEQTAANAVEPAEETVN